MSIAYDNYLNEHIENVSKAFEWLRVNLPDILYPIDSTLTRLYFRKHDQSKYGIEEYELYDDYFYGPESEETKEAFNYAWLHHIHHNPHHWQYWVLVNDNPDEGIIGLDIPLKWVIEMICDWWSFSWKTGDLYGIFDWYEKHKDNMILSKNTRELVEQILVQIKEKLDEQSRKEGG